MALTRNNNFPIEFDMSQVLSDKKKLQEIEYFNDNQYIIKQIWILICLIKIYKNIEQGG